MYLYFLYTVANFFTNFKFILLHYSTSNAPEMSETYSNNRYGGQVENLFCFVYIFVCLCFRYSDKVQALVSKQVIGQEQVLT